MISIVAQQSSQQKKSENHQPLYEEDHSLTSSLPYSVPVLLIFEVYQYQYLEESGGQQYLLTQRLGSKYDTVVLCIFKTPTKIQGDLRPLNPPQFECFGPSCPLAFLDPPSHEHQNTLQVKEPIEKQTVKRLDPGNGHVTQPQGKVLPSDIQYILCEATLNPKSRKHQSSSVASLLRVVMKKKAVSASIFPPPV